MTGHGAPRAAPQTSVAHKFRPYGFLLLFLLVFSTGVVSEFLDPFINQLFDFVFR